ncbi:MAG: hypothetical protein K0Q87_81 [Neobacillus sp.]|nr:hypothetical protein [Neobacillus sp.]
MALMSQETEDGTYQGYPEEYKNKAWPILTILQLEILPSLSTGRISNENSIIQLDDRTGMTCLPYGLAAHLLMEEDEQKAAFFNARYDELKLKRPATISVMRDSYWEGTSTSDGGSSNGYDGGEW